jgi:hypothetical protein
MISLTLLSILISSKTELRNTPKPPQQGVGTMLSIEIKGTLNMSNSIGQTLANLTNAIKEYEEDNLVMRDLIGSIIQIIDNQQIVYKDEYIMELLGKSRLMETDLTLTEYGFDCIYGRGNCNDIT